MKPKVADTLTRFANARERAYRAAGSLRMAQLSAISKIKLVAQTVKGKSEQVQLRAVIRLQSELTEIMPHPESRYKKLRQNIQHLIQQAHGITSHHPKAI